MRCTKQFDFKGSKKWTSELDDWTKENSIVCVDGSGSFWSHKMLVGFPDSLLLASNILRLPILLLWDVKV